jgi:hypothetical protein
MKDKLVTASIRLDFDSEVIAQNNGQNAFKNGRRSALRGIARVQVGRTGGDADQDTPGGILRQGQL